MKKIQVHDIYRHCKTNDIAWNVRWVDMKNNQIELEAIGYDLFFRGTFEHFYASFESFCNIKEADND